MRTDDRKAVGTKGSEGQAGARRGSQDPEAGGAWNLHARKWGGVLQPGVKWGREGGWGGSGPRGPGAKPSECISKYSE